MCHINKCLYFSSLPNSKLKPKFNPKTFVKISQNGLLLNHVTFLSCTLV